MRMNIEKENHWVIYSRGKSTFKGALLKLMVIRSLLIGKGQNLCDLSVNRAVTFQVGDAIECGYYGVIKESHPFQINTLFVKLVE